MPSAEPIVLDSVTHLGPDARGRIGYCGSHGGRYCGWYVASKGMAGVILNDAGIGRERAGLGGPLYLERIGVPAATISNHSARIGDGRDGVARGVLSFVNTPAANLGLAIGMPCGMALDILAKADLAPARVPPPEAEHRHELTAAVSGAVAAGIRVIAMDSISLVAAEDVGHIVVTGSHGALLSGKPESAVRHPVLAVVCNDAGWGRDHAGISRLPALDARGIAGACVSHFSARIGDGLSNYQDGYVSALNEAAKRIGGLVGQSCRDLVAALLVSADGLRRSRSGSR